MLRAAGCALIFGGSMLLRRELLKKPLLEIRTARALAAALRLLEQEVALTLLPLPKLLERGQDAFSRAVSGNLKNGLGLAESWAAAAQTLALPKEKGERFAALGASLAGEEGSVRKALLQMAEQLEREAERQQDGMREKRRLTGAFCLSGGIFVCILLL